MQAKETARKHARILEPRVTTDLERAGHWYTLPAWEFCRNHHDLHRHGIASFKNGTQLTVPVA